MGNIDLEKAFSHAWETFAKHPVPMIVGGLLMMLVSAVSAFLLYGVMAGGMFLIIKKAFEGQEPQIGDVFGGFSLFGNLFLAYLFAALVGIVGLLLCCVGVIFTIPLVVFLFPLIINGFTTGEAISKSWEGYKKNFVGWFVVSLISGVLVSVGNMIAIGWIFTIPFSMCFTYACFLQVFAEPEAAAMPPEAPAQPAPPVAEEMAAPVEPAAPVVEPTTEEPAGEDEKPSE
ncbi:MAG: hypothetical protein P9L99_08805 [Candidatus Lernaella stagnicola]|nr:hypothetical protein [Candidatus Lernaella stagnicola]